MADEDLDAEVRQAARVGAVRDVAALHLVAEVVQHLGDTGHADTADADEMNETYIEWQRSHAGTPREATGKGAAISSETMSARRAAASGRPAACAAEAMAARRCGASNSAIK